MLFMATHTSRRVASVILVVPPVVEVLSNSHYRSLLLMEWTSIPAAARAFATRLGFATH